ncbi:MAG: hypothetical protein HY053_04380 [Proteobacteria bacterium]|nr:hypothetical protein [Pseudomonadota bacterium]
MTVTIRNMRPAQLKAALLEDGYVSPEIYAALPSPTELAEAFRKCAKFLVTKISEEALLLKERAHAMGADTSALEKSLDEVMGVAQLVNATDTKEILNTDMASLEDALGNVNDRTHELRTSSLLTEPDMETIDKGVTVLNDTANALYTLQVDYGNLTKNDNFGEAEDDRLAYETYGDYMQALNKFAGHTSTRPSDRNTEEPVDAVPMFLSPSRVKKLGLESKVAGLKQAYELK